MELIVHKNKVQNRSKPSRFRGNGSIGARPVSTSGFSRGSGVRAGLKVGQVFFIHKIKRS
jgi:hypothetical protein